MRQQFQMNPNTTLMVSRCKVVGGRTTTREKLSDEMLEDAEGNPVVRSTEAKLHVQIDNAPERKEAEKIAAKGVHIIRSRATYTDLGYFADRAKIPEIDKAFRELTQEAAKFNAEAKTCHVKIGWLHNEFNANAECARAMADHVREELEGLRDALRAGEHAQVRAILLPTKAGNLHQLATGVQRDAIKLALDEGKTALAKLKEDLKAKCGGSLPKTTGENTSDAARIRQAAQLAGAALDLGQIETAIELFRYEDAEDVGDPAEQAA